MIRYLSSPVNDRRIYVGDPPRLESHAETTSRLERREPGEAMIDVMTLDEIVARGKQCESLRKLNIAKLMTEYRIACVAHDRARVADSCDQVLFRIEDNLYLIALVIYELNGGAS